MWLLGAIAGRANAVPGEHVADQQTLQRIARGEDEAFVDLYDRHVRSIYSLALRIVRDHAEAEEVVQDVFSQAWRQAQRFDAARGNVSAWLLTLTKSRAIDRLRGRRSRAWEASDHRDAADVLDTGLGPDAQAASAEQIGRVRASLRSIPLAERIVLELAYFEGHTHSEIAAQLELPLGTVKTRIRQGLLRLRAAMAGEV
jgi:RNA polymerase sigma-70 factor (ECF subfamily)